MGQGHLLAGRYRLDAVVGRGGMGTVWRAHDSTLDREVAIKEVLLPPGLSPAERDVLYERTFREARASARLNHPGVVTVHDVVEEAGRPWIVMEFVRARSLQDMIDESGTLPPRRVAEIGKQTLGALRHAHEKGILHRDVKPSNVLITADDRAVLTDFGIAQMEGDATLTQTGLVMGSPAYIPPERAQGERAVPASDLWALGATLYAAVEGQSPYERPDAMASLAAALSEPVPPPRKAGPLGPVLEGLLAREPMYRMTADQAMPLLVEVAGRPEQVGWGETAQPPTPAAAQTRFDPPSMRSRQFTPPPPPVDAAETVLDAPEIEAATRLDTGSAQPMYGRADASGRSEAYGRVEAGGRPDTRSRSGAPGRSDAYTPTDVSGQPGLYGHAQTADSFSETETFDSGPRRQPSQQVPQQPTPPRPPGDDQTLLQTDWSPSVQPQPTQAPGNLWQQPQDFVVRRERERKKTIAIVAIAVFLIVAAALIGAMILHNQANASGGDDTSGGGTSAGAGAPKPPAGFTAYAEKGFSIAVPEAWKRTEQNSGVYFTSPDGRTYVQVDKTPWSGTALTQAQYWDSVQRGQQTAKPNFRAYQRVGEIKQLTYAGTQAADVEFTSRRSDGGINHSLDRFFRAGQQPYALYFQTPRNNWANSQANRTKILQSFTPERS